MLEWAEDEDSVDALRKRTAEHFHGSILCEYVCLFFFFFQLMTNNVFRGRELRRFPLNVRAISSKIIDQKSTQRTVRFCILFEPSHCNSFL